MLQFAGFAMLILALFVKLRMPDWMMLLICTGMSLSGACLNGADVGNSFGIVKHPTCYSVEYTV